MQVLLLGTAAGGAFPQWNCWCSCCTTARRDPAAAHPRTQSSIAVSADGARWFLVNASPDVREQLAVLGGRAGGREGGTSGGQAGQRAGGQVDRTALRHVPFEGVVLTDAELDHSLGVVLLREAGALTLYCTPSVERILREDSGVLATTEAFARVAVTPLVPGTRTALLDRQGCPSGLTVEPFPVPADPPRFAAREEPAHTIGLLLRGDDGTSVAYLPGCGDLDDPLLARLATADLVLFDGTFWTDDELIALGAGTRTARQLDHLPISGPGGSLARLSQLTQPRVVYVHLNNTNPVLLEQSPERAAVVAAGLTVGDDGMHFDLAAGTP